MLLLLSGVTLLKHKHKKGIKNILIYTELVLSVFNAHPYFFPQKFGQKKSALYTAIYSKLQNNYHPESSENQAIWKSNDQGIEEVTFIQMGRRAQDAET